MAKVDPTANPKPMTRLLLVSKLDKEDLCIICAFALPAFGETTYKAAIEKNIDTLTSPRFVGKLVDELCLEDDVFESNEWELDAVNWKNGACEFSFLVEDAGDYDTHFIPMQCDFIFLPTPPHNP